MVLRGEEHTVVSLLKSSSESRGWGLVPWCGHLEPNQLPQPLQPYVEGASLSSCPTCPFSKCHSVPRSGRADTVYQRLLVLDEQRAQEVPYSFAKVAVGGRSRGGWREGVQAWGCAWQRAGQGPSVWLHQCSTAQLQQDTTSCAFITW